MPLVCSTPVPSLKWIWHTVQELRWLQFSNDHQHSNKFFNVFLQLEGDQIRIQISYFYSQKALPKRRRMTYCACGAFKNATYGRGRDQKRTETFLCQTAFADEPPWNFACEPCEVISISSYMKIGRGGSQMWEVKNHRLPLTWPMAYIFRCISHDIIGTRPIGIIRVEIIKSQGKYAA